MSVFKSIKEYGYKKCHTQKERGGIKKRGYLTLEGENNYVECKMEKGC